MKELGSDGCVSEVSLGVDTENHLKYGNGYMILQIYEKPLNCTI